MKPQRVGDLTLPGVTPGSVYVLRSRVSAHGPYGSRDVLHVISRLAGGEIRGYERAADSDDPWTVRPPAHEGDWAEVDQAVAKLTGDAVVGLSGTVRSAAQQLALPIGGAA